MITFIESYFTYSDSRGHIIGLINNGTWREINLIKSDAGIIRGNHYHKITTEGFAILSGKIEVTIQKVKAGHLIDNFEIYQVAESSIFIIQPMVWHSFNVQEPAVWLNFLDVSINKSAPDIYRI
jgi:dTDP-4-dehydrorhamnose 3,5-epimerase-like enzyme